MCSDDVRVVLDKKAVAWCKAVGVRPGFGLLGSFCVRLSMGFSVLGIDGFVDQKGMIGI